ncbi:hypothetical protein J9B83_07750 [Marinomonas sp. A79]|uniref:Uncharacterized protein n=1 Tax=Marinomonas vulgaris TaxID=2823372 RepID=A0ABS5HB10_9GAMM|nr:hypothetical protein [Marinomonas vulgaris]MBR7888837.1 hypothetical protein [Marinomonas vulgaris]
MNTKTNRLEHLENLLENLEKVSLDDISQIPSSQQHILVEKIESLQDELKVLMMNHSGITH